MYRSFSWIEVFEHVNEERSRVFCVCCVCNGEYLVDTGNEFGHEFRHIDGILACLGEEEVDCKVVVCIVVRVIAVRRVITVVYVITDAFEDEVHHSHHFCS